MHVDLRDQLEILLTSGWSPGVDRLVRPNENAELPDPGSDNSAPRTLLGWDTEQDEQEVLSAGNHLQLEGSWVGFIWAQRAAGDRVVREIADGLADLFLEASTGSLYFAAPTLGESQETPAYYGRRIDIFYRYLGGLIVGDGTVYEAVAHGYTADDVGQVLEGSGTSWVLAPTATFGADVGLLVQVVDADHIGVVERPGVVPITLAGRSPGDELWRSQSTAGAMATAPAGSGWRQYLGHILPSGRPYWSPQPPEEI